jgi:tight adherence protein B
MMNFILISTFLSALLFVYPILNFLIGKQNPITRLNRYTNSIAIDGEGKRQSKQKEFKSGLSFIARGVKDAKSLDGYKKKIQLELQKAHILLKPEEYITVSIILFFALGLRMFILMSSSTFAIIFAIIGGVIGWVLPSFYLKIKIKKRIRFLNDQLNDAIVLISNSLKAGYSFFQAVDIVAKEMTGPMAEEFTQLQKEVNFGTTTEKALENLVTRVTSDDLELVVTAVLIQRQVGGNLAEVLDNISSTIRERIKIKGEVRTITAQGRMSGLIIALLPPGLGFILYLINPEHIGLLFKDPIGIAILIFSVFMELIGIYFINKIVKIQI